MPKGKPEEGGATDVAKNANAKAVKTWLKANRKAKVGKDQATTNAEIEATIDAAQADEIGLAVAKLHGMTETQWQEARSS